MANFVSCVKWVKRGVAKSVPDKVQLTSEELKNIWSARREETQAQEEDVEYPHVSEPAEDGYNFESYDNETENIQSVLGIESMIAMDASHTVAEDDMDSEAEDDIIKADDNLLVVGHVEEDANVLEVHIYNESSKDMYVHHDILLPTLPLCLEWFNFEPAQPTPGNLIAVGGMCPEIMIWDLDIVNCLEPAFKLGRHSKNSSKKPEKQNFGHKDAVLDICWNKNVNHIMASASVDKSAIIWDLEYGKVGMQLSEFTDKVQSIKWHPEETQTLLTGCCDKYVRLYDCHTNLAVSKWDVNGEVESVCWNAAPDHSWEALVGTDNGTVFCIDTRKNKSIWQINAHEKEVTGLSAFYDSSYRMVSCSTDGSLKTWDLSQENPSLIFSKNTPSGDLHCLDLNPDNPYIACTGGSKKNHVFSITNLRKHISDSCLQNWTPQSGVSMLENVDSTRSAETVRRQPHYSTLSIKKPFVKNLKMKKKRKLRN